jgi:hypothetical protein
LWTIYDEATHQGNIAECSWPFVFNTTLGHRLMAWIFCPLRENENLVTDLTFLLSAFLEDRKFQLKLRESAHVQHFSYDPAV